ncbi:MAG: outer membrane lipoprotein carrier protein LolA [Lysobacteraceae bacterium]|nr:MAG: outer membrane lipoprotein carrier protein LolA [Xanthomonadaceae bacterium]
MKGLHRCAVLLALSCWALFAFGAVAKEGDGVRARLAKPAVLRGQFEQEKQLHGFRNPLKSSGDFLLLRDRGIAWNTRAPFASSTRLTRKRLLATMPDGSTQVLVDAGASPGMAAVNALLMALVAGDLDALSTRFTLKETLRGDAGWSLALQPRDAALKRAFVSIVLEGDRYVRAVEIVEPGGDRTRIRFAAVREAPPATRAEASQLD